MTRRIPGRWLLEPGCLVFLEHHFGRFDDHRNFVSLFETKLFGATAGNYALDLVLSNLDDDMGHDVAQLNFFDFSTQFVSG